MKDNDSFLLCSDLIPGVATAENPTLNPVNNVPRYRNKMAWVCLPLGKRWSISKDNMRTDIHTFSTVCCVYN